ncbi:MAG TPA: hypothetical protein ENH01_09790 [Nitrospirae bacterium]|nr:hypothetical protein [Nitrospirota bacterium]
MENGQPALGGTWVITIIMVIIVSWVVFRVKGHLWASLFGGGDGMAIVEMLAGYTFVFLGRENIYGCIEKR